MKKRLVNSIMNICNVIGAVGLFIITIPYTYKYGIGFNEIITDEIRRVIEVQMIYRYFIAYIILGGANLICGIQNRRNKKTMFWYVASAIEYMLLAAMIDSEEYITSIFWNTNILDTLSFIVVILIAIISLVLIIIDVIKIIKNKKSKKKIIIYVLAILFILFMVILFKRGLGYLLIMFFTIMQFIDNEGDQKEEKKVKKIINMIFYLIVTISVIVILVRAVDMYIYAWKLDQQMIAFRNEIEENMESVDEDEQIVIVSDSNGYGAINLKGEEVIPCGKYESIVSVEGCDVYLATKDIQYIYLANDGTILSTCEWGANPWLADNKLKNDRRNEVRKALNWIQEEVLQDESEDYNVIELEEQHYEDGKWKRAYKLNETYTIEIEEIDDIEEVNIRLKDKDEIIDNENNTCVLEGVPGLFCFSDGSVPYFDIENEVQGWFDDETGKKYTIKGKYQILDIVQDKVVIRAFNDISSIRNDIVQDNIREFIINKNGEVLLIAKRIEVLKNGFIIKNENNKFVYMDSNLEIKTEEFDCIEGSAAEKGVLICKIKDGKNTEKCMLLNLDGKKLTKKMYLNMYNVPEEDVLDTNYLLDFDYYYYNY